MDWISCCIERLLKLHETVFIFYLLQWQLIDIVSIPFGWWRIKRTDRYICGQLKCKTLFKTYPITTFLLSTVISWLKKFGVQTKIASRWRSSFYSHSTLAERSIDGNGLFFGQGTLMVRDWPTEELRWSRIKVMFTGLSFGSALPIAATSDWLELGVGPG